MAETAAGDCFGLLWDISTKQCSVCADNEVCGILTGNNTRQQAKEVEKIKKFLDVSELDMVNEDDIKMWLSMKPRSVENLIGRVSAYAKTTDVTAVVEWCKRFIKANDKIYTKEGIVYTRK